MPWTPTPRRPRRRRPRNEADLGAVRPSPTPRPPGFAGLGGAGRAGPAPVPGGAGRRLPGRGPVGRAPDPLGPLDGPRAPGPGDGLGVGRRRVFLPDGSRRRLGLAGPVPD